MSNYYNMLELYRTSLIPFRMNIQIFKEWLINHKNPLHNTGFANIMLAYLILTERITRNYKKPKFNINECMVDGVSYVIEEQVIVSKTFCQLKHFRKVGITKTLPKLLILAPMAGHHATLARDTVKGLLPFVDIYITDWVDANMVPLKEGKFDLDDFIDYIIEFLILLGPNLHTLAVCQPTIPLLAAISILSQNNDIHVPSSMTLIGGPIDARLNPTAVDNLATRQSMDWFCRVMTTTVPINYPGYGRKVYPGFLQLMAFMSLDIPRHTNSHLELLQNLLDGNITEANHTIAFYDEYLAPMDMTAEFYLQTIHEVFKEFALAKGELISQNRKINLKDITKCALLGIEGERDNIAAVGQTKVALELCCNIPDSMKRYHLQEGAGHYGTFSGSKFNKFIVPVIKDFIYQYDATNERIDEAANRVADNKLTKGKQAKNYH